MLAVRILGRAIAALWIKWFFVLSFALPCFIVMSPGLLPLSGPDFYTIETLFWALGTLLLVVPILWTILAIAWFRTLAQPAHYPTPLHGLRGQPLWPFLRVALPAFALALVAAIGAKYLLLLTSSSLPAEVRIWLLSFYLVPGVDTLLPQTIGSLCFFVLGLGLPGIAVMKNSLICAPTRYALRNLPQVFILFLLLGAAHILLQIQLWNLLHSGVETLERPVFAMAIPRPYDPTLVRIFVVANSVLSGMFHLVELGVMVGYFREFMMTHTDAE